MEKWNQWTTWLLDVFKGILVFSIGATITVFGLNAIEAERDFHNFQRRANWEYDFKVAEEYRAASLAYVQATMGALAEVSRGEPGTRSIEWMTAENTRFLQALEAVEIRYGNRDREVSQLVQQLKDIHPAIYREYRSIESNPQKPGVYDYSPTFLQLQQRRTELAKVLDHLMTTNVDSAGARKTP